MIIINKNSFHTFLVLSILIYIIFFPTFAFNFSLSEGQILLYISLPAIFLVSILIYKKIKIDRIATTLIFILIFNILSLAPKLSYVSIDLVFGNLRYLAYSIVYIFSYNLSIKYRISHTSIINSIQISLFLIFIFLLFQYFEINQQLTSYITNRGLSDYYGFRIGGPFIWSYSLGFYLILPFFISLSLLLTQSKNILFNAIVSLTCLLIFILTQSKSIYISLLFSIIVFYIIVIGKNKLGRNLLLLVPILLVLIYSYQYIYHNIEEFGNINRFFVSIAEGGIDESTQTRISQINNINQITVFGSPESSIIIENAYGYYLYHNGLLGLFMYIFIVGHIILKNYSAYKRALKTNMKDYNLIAISIAFFMFSLSLIFVSLSQSPLDGHKTSYLFWVLLGCYQGSIYIKNKEIT